MAAQSDTTARAYRCPECGGVLAFDDRAWECTDCRYVPRHSAD